MTFEEARGQFPVLEHVAYLNAGTNGPLARATVAAMTAQAEADLERGRSGREWIDAMLAGREAVRERIARVLNVEPTLLALTSSTTSACNIVLAGLGLRPEDEVVTTDSEHFGLLGPLHTSGARVVVVPGSEDAILGAVTPRTRLIAVSHVLWTTGKRLALERLKAETDVPVLVDGAQSVGAIPVNASSFDFYTVSAQKWLCGPEATGALYVADPDGLRITAPSYMSQDGYEPDGRFRARAGAVRFDAGWIAMPLLAGLTAALDAHPDWRYERAAEMTRRCHDLLAERVDVVTDAVESTLVAFRSDDPPALVNRLAERGVIVRDIPRTDLVRVSCGYWTSDDDLEQLVDALA